MQETDRTSLATVLLGEHDPEIVELEARLRAAQLAADVAALDALIAEDLLFTGPDGSLGTKEQDLAAHASGAVRFREHVPEELRVHRVGANVALTSLRAADGGGRGHCCAGNLPLYASVGARGRRTVASRRGTRECGARQPWHAMNHVPPLLILIAGPYRSGTGDDPGKLAENVRVMESYALPLFRAGHVPLVGEWLALPLVAAAGSKRVGDAAFDEIFHPVAERLLARCDAVLRVGGPSQGADLMVATAESRGLRVFHSLADVPGCGSI